MTFFDDLDVQVSAEITDVFAEPVLLHPRVSSPYSERRPDPEHPDVMIEGIYSVGSAQKGLGGQASGFSGATQVTSAVAEVWIAKAQVAALHRRPQKGDALTLTGRAGAPVYALSQVHPSDMGDLTLILVLEDETP